MKYRQRQKKLMVVLAACFLFVISIPLSHLEAMNTISVFAVFVGLTSFGFLAGFLANEAFFADGYPQDNHPTPNFSITEGDTLANIRPADSCRLIPSDPPPSLSVDSSAKKIQELEARCVALRTRAHKAEEFKEKCRSFMVDLLEVDPRNAIESIEEEMRNLV